MRKAAIIALLLSTLAQAGPLEEGYESLSRGDLKESARLFSTIKGVEGRVARATQHMEMLEFNEALDLLDGDSVPILVTRLQVLLEAERLTDASELLKQLERLKHSKFDQPYRFRFYLARGELMLWSHEFELAQKNFNEAKRQSRSPEDRVEVATQEISLKLFRNDLDGAEELMASQGKNVSQLENVWVLCRWLRMTARVHSRSGRLATTHSVLRAEREIHLSRGNARKAADSLFALQKYFQLANDKKAVLANCEASLEELLNSGAYHALPRCLATYRQIRFSLGTTDFSELEGVYQRVLEQVHPGPDHDHIELSYLFYLSAIDIDSGELLEKYEKFLERVKVPRLRLAAMRQMAIRLRKAG